VKRALTIAAILSTVAAFFALDLHRELTLEALRASIGDWQAWRDTDPLLAALLFGLAYVAVAALSLPGAAILTLAAGALFGLGWGTLIVSFASSIGATLAFFAARHLLRDSVQGRFGQRLAAIDEGIARDGAWYLFTLRLVPAFPFFLINLLMGLTRLPAFTFYWVSQLGMLAGTLVYVNAGTQLAAVDSLSGILSPGLWLSFALLGVFPWLARGALRIWQRRRVYARWRRPARFDRNLLVIGGGAAGLVTAYIAAAVRAKVTLIESHRMGGDCLNYGCVPSKALIKSARIAHTVRLAGHYGIGSTAPEVDFPAVMRRVRQVIADIAPHDSVERYTGLGVEVLRGRGRLVDPWTVEVTADDGSRQRLTARSIVLATGAAPAVPPLPGLAEAGFVTSDTLWDALAELPAAPPRVAVLGGGPIGCELAQALARLGSHVTLVERLPQLMGQEDAEVAAAVMQALRDDGVTVLADHAALRCERRDGVRELVVAPTAGSASAPGAGPAVDEQRVGFDLLLVATGRQARLQGYGLEGLGIPAGRTIQTNVWLETLYPNIYAAGDVAGPYQFTHAAAHQAWYAAVNALFGQFRRFAVDYSALPQVTFVEPEVARVGHSRTSAREAGIDFEVTRYALDDLDRAIADGQTAGFVQVLTVPGKDRILGVTIVGERAGDLISEYTLAMRNGLGLNNILGTIHPYPTFGEANKYAAGVWKRAHAPQGVLRWLTRYHRWMRGGSA